MKFVDVCDVDVVAGNGGNGAVAFRREKFVPFGGPSGGDGGRGADIVFLADNGLSTLLDLTSGRTIRGDDGEHGRGSDCYGKAAPEVVVRVPVGTQVFDRDAGTLLFDIDEANMRVVVARGGKGGRGNIHFATPHDRAPRRSEPGEPGHALRLRLELKVMADVGLLGFPNVGKSTFIRSVSRAQPKVADYPFTTLTPHLGVVRVGDEASYVIADIPGLIPGASEGAGLGHRFLKHVERCRALLHLITLDPGDDRDPIADYDALRLELERFDPTLAERTEIVALTKADLPEVREAYTNLKKKFAKRGIDLRLVSAATGEGVKQLAQDVYKTVTGRARIEDWDAPAEPQRPVTPATQHAVAQASSGSGTKKSASTATKTATPAEASKKATPASKTAKKAAPASKTAKKAAPASKTAKTKPAATSAGSTRSSVGKRTAR